jgi:hypothetical protein
MGLYEDVQSCQAEGRWYEGAGFLVFIHKLETCGLGCAVAIAETLTLDRFNFVGRTGKSRLPYRTDLFRGVEGCPDMSRVDNVPSKLIEAVSSDRLADKQ